MPTPRPVPGDLGLPLVGVVQHTLEFMRGWEAYFLSRRALHGGVFYTNVGGPAITLLDPIAVAAALDVTKVKKRYGFGPKKPAPALVGDIVPIMFTNDAEHDALKGFLLNVLRQRFARLPEVYAEVAPRWFASLVAPFDASKAIEGLLAELVFTWLLEVKADPADLRGWLDTLLVTKFLPFENDTDRHMAACYTRLLALVKTSPVLESLAAQAPAGLDRDAVAKHLLYVAGFNAWSGLRGLLTSMVAELAAMSEPERSSIQGESNPWRPPEDLAAPEAGIQRVVLESLRLHPPAPIVFGEARADFELPTATGPVQVREGEILMSVLTLAQRDPSLGDPEAFRPARFEDPGMARRALFWAGGPDGVPTGASNTVCPGQDIVPAIARAFCADWSRAQVTLSEPSRWSRITMIQANRPENGVPVGGFWPGRRI